MTQNTIIKKIKELRIKKGLSQDELANLAGLSLRTIQRIEKEETNPHGDTLRKIILILEDLPDLELSHSEKEQKTRNVLIERYAQISHSSYHKTVSKLASGIDAALESQHKSVILAIILSASTFLSLVVTMIFSSKITFPLAANMAVFIIFFRGFFVESEKRTILKTLQMLE